MKTAGQNSVGYYSTRFTNCNNMGRSKDFSNKGGGGHTVSHPGYLPHCYVVIQALFKKMARDIFRMSSERGERRA